jgi:hypothetical protein
MERGDAKTSVFVYKDEYDKKYSAGLVAWRDRNIVYCMTNDCNTSQYDDCTRRSKDGLINLRRPLCIAKYNKYMGGVDLADMRRLHCNSTIMGQNRWWLKLFFYLLDVGTSNALVLYNLGREMIPNNPKPPINIVDFKLQLIQQLVEDKIEGTATTNDNEEHVPIHVENNMRKRCAFCALMSQASRTRFVCSVCEVPLCCIGNGRIDKDCFTMAHKTEETRQLVVEKHDFMQKRTTEKNKKKK